MTVMARSAENDRILSAITSRSDVTSVYIGKAALRLAGSNALAGKLGGDAKDGDRVTKAVKNLESVEIVNCEKKSVIPDLRKEVERLVQKLGLEVLVEAREPGESVMIYGIVPADGSDVIDSMLIEANEGNEYSLVFIKGKIDLSALYKDGSHGRK